MKKNSTLKWGLIIMAALLTRIADFTAYAQVDPIKFNLTTTATAVTLNEEIDCGVIVWDDSDNSIISNNAISDGTGDGIFIWGAAPQPAKIPIYSRTITITGNTISNKSIGWGISVRYGEGVAITGNTVTGCKWGIGGDPNGYSETDSSAKSLNISGNIISNCQHGLYTFSWDSW